MDFSERNQVADKVSEEVRTRYKNGKQIRYWFKPGGVCNEALDALYSRNVPWEILIRNAPTGPPEDTPPKINRRREAGPRQRDRSHNRCALEWAGDHSRFG